MTDGTERMPHITVLVARNKKLMAEERKWRQVKLEDRLHAIRKGKR